jgi:nucleoid-associated protein YgaU
VNVLEYVPPALAVAAPPPPAAAAVQRNDAGGGGGGSGGGRTYTVKRGDTLSGIAGKVLGNAGRWHDIANLNGIRDPRTLRVGQVLRLP